MTEGSGSLFQRSAADGLITALADETAEPLDAAAGLALVAAKNLLEVLILHDVLEPQGLNAAGRVGRLSLAALKRGFPKERTLKRLERLLSVAVDFRPDDFRVWFWRGLLALWRQDDKGALSSFQRAAGCFSGSSLSFHYAAAILDRFGEDETAERYERAACEGAGWMFPAALRLARGVRRSDPLAASRHFAALWTFPPPQQLYGRSLVEAEAERTAGRLALAVERFIGDGSAEALPDGKGRLAPGVNDEAVWSAASDHALAQTLAAAAALGAAPLALPKRAIAMVERRYRGHAVYRVDGVSGGLFFAAPTYIPVGAPRCHDLVLHKVKAGALTEIEGTPVYTALRFLDVTQMLDEAFDVDGRPRVSPAAGGGDIASSGHGMWGVA